MSDPPKNKDTLSDAFSGKGVLLGKVGDDHFPKPNQPKAQLDLRGDGTGVIDVGRVKNISNSLPFSSRDEKVQGADDHKLIQNLGLRSSSRFNPALTATSTADWYS